MLSDSFMLYFWVFNNLFSIYTVSSGSNLTSRAAGMGVKE